MTTDVLELLQKLPKVCLASLASIEGPILIKRGVSGYWPASPLLTVDGFNERHGVTPAQREAMLAGSMFGWDCPGADADNYDEAGRPLPVKGEDTIAS